MPACDEEMPMKITTPIKSIRKKCLDCSGGLPKEVRSCPANDCPLHPYRFGKNPARKGIAPNRSKIVKKSLGELDKIDKGELLDAE